MYLAYKLTRGTIKSIVSEAEPWQIGLGVFLGTMLGFIPIIAPFNLLAWGLIVLVCLMACHVGSALLFLGIGTLLGKALHGPAVTAGDSLRGFAQQAADTTLLHWCQLSHTGYLGLTIFGLGFALVFSIGMVLLTRWIRGWIKAKLEANAQLAKLGKLADRPFLIRVLCWFFGL